jgi:RNA polymerase sigma-54 factor
MLGRGAGHSSMRAQLQEARWLLKSLEIRNETLMKVARSIVERQTAFLEHGEESMRPMILKDIAQAIDMHESTISRVTSSKYMHTPRGVFELKYFFSSQVEAADGGGASSTAFTYSRGGMLTLGAIGFLLVHSTDCTLSDSTFTDDDSGETHSIAVQVKGDLSNTQAKYREALGLAPSNERKARAAGR